VPTCLPECVCVWGGGGIPGAELSGAEGPSWTGPVSWAGHRVPWHGCGLPLARDSLARGGGRGLPGSRDGEVEPGRPGSSPVTRASVCCKQSLEDNGKRGGRRGKGTCLQSSLQVPNPLVRLNRKASGRHPGVLQAASSGLGPRALPVTQPGPLPSPSAESSEVRADTRPPKKPRRTCGAQEARHRRPQPGSPGAQPSSPPDPPGPHPPPSVAGVQATVLPPSDPGVHTRTPPRSEPRVQVPSSCPIRPRGPRPSALSLRARSPGLPQPQRPRPGGSSRLDSSQLRT
jgi:hypothetical protein